MLAPLIARIRSLWNGVLRSRHVDAELHEEFRTHRELRAADLVRAGMSSAEAARLARAEFGSTEDQVEKAAAAAAVLLQKKAVRLRFIAQKSHICAAFLQ